MFLGLPETNPDPFVRGTEPDPQDPYVFGPPGSGSVSTVRVTDPDPIPAPNPNQGPDPSIIKKNSKKNFDFFMTFYLCKMM